MSRLWTIAFCLFLAACGNTVSSLQYSPPPSVSRDIQPSIDAVTSVDQRKEKPKRLATIMGGFGNPLKTLDTAKPVKDEVADAFTEGLRARGMLSSNHTPFHLVLTIRKFDSDMLVGRTARIDLTASIVDQSGRTIYEDAVADSESETKFFETGVLADIKDLQRLCEVVLARTVDRVLDKPGFRNAVAQTTPGS